MKLVEPHEKKLCGAKTRTEDRHPCRKPPLRGSNRCKLHGGASLVGLASPQFKHGANSRVLPIRIQEAYEASRSDPDQLALRNDIAVIDARLIDLMRQVDESPGKAIWNELSLAWDQFKFHRLKGDADMVRVSIELIGEKITAGMQDHAMWAQIVDLIDRRRKLVETEQKRLVAAQQMITLDRAMVMFHYVTEVIRRHVRDRDTLQAISAEFRALSVGSNGSQDESRG